MTKVKGKTNVIAPLLEKKSSPSAANIQATLNLPASNLARRATGTILQQSAQYLPRAATVGRMAAKGSKALLLGTVAVSGTGFAASTVLPELKEVTIPKKWVKDALFTIAGIGYTGMAVSYMAPPLLSATYQKIDTFAAEDRVPFILEKLVLAAPEDRHEAILDHLKQEWKNLREPFIKLSSTDPEQMLQGAVALSAIEGLNEVFGWNGPDQTLKEAMWGIVEDLRFDEDSGLKEGDLTRVMAAFTAAAQQVPNNGKEWFWMRPMVQEPEAAALKNAGDAISALAMVMANARVPEAKRLEIIEKFNVDFEKLTPHSQKLARIAFVTPKGQKLDWNKAYAAIGRTTGGKEFREELQKYGYINENGALTEKGAKAVKKNTTEQALSALRKKYS